MKTLLDLQKDDLRGATSIFRDALALFLTYANPNAVLNDADILRNQFPAMGLFQNLCRQLNGLRELQDIQERLNQFSDRLDLAFNQVVEKALTQLPKHSRIMTISNSSYVRELIQQGQEKIKFVYCLRSAPKNEGAGLAETLEGRGIPVKIMEDDDYESALTNTSLIIVGSDLLSDHFFINKAGTKALVERAYERAIPVWILGDSLRYVGDYKQEMPATFEVIPLHKEFNVIG